MKFISLDLPYSNDMAVNNLIATNLTKKAGKYLGRRTVITKKLIAEVQDLKENKNLSVTQIAKITGKGRNTIYRVLKEKLNYVPHTRLVKQKPEIIHSYTPFLPEASLMSLNGLYRGLTGHICIHLLYQS